MACEISVDRLVVARAPRKHWVSNRVAPAAQLDRAPLSEGGGHTFESWRAASSKWSLLDTWVTDYTDDIGNTFGPKGFARGSSLQVSSSKYPRSSWSTLIVKRGVGTLNKTANCCPHSSPTTISSSAAI
jgi:hypothetical protein